jgi:hypothetical protein
MLGPAVTGKRTEDVDISILPIYPAKHEVAPAVFRTEISRPSL